MLTTCDELFMAALAALDPPMCMLEERHFNGLSAHVAEYNAFVHSVGFMVLPDYSYAEWSRWFHGNGIRKNKKPLTPTPGP